jgi:hypothetical protein
MHKPRGIVTFKKEKLGKGNRMIRIGLGQHKSVWFVRLDYWFGFVRATF